MKYCCDRCEKPIETNCLVNTIGATFVTVRKVFTSNIVLCSECGKKLERFLEKGRDEK